MKRIHLLAIVLPLVGSTLVACVGSSDEDGLATEDAPTRSSGGPGASGSAPLSPAPQPSSSAAPGAGAASADDAGVADASSEAAADADASANATADAAADAAADASSAPAFDCTPIAMRTDAPPTSCSIDMYKHAGGTLTLGTYVLSEWGDSTTTCPTTGQRKGTMSLVQIDGKLYMRWTRGTDTSTSSGTFLLTQEGAATISRGEVCNKRFALLGPSSMGFTATSTEIVFGQERWTRISTKPDLVFAKE